MYNELFMWLLHTIISIHGDETKVLISVRPSFYHHFLKHVHSPMSPVTFFVHALYCVICIPNILTILLVPVGTRENNNNTF